MTNETPEFNGPILITGASSDIGIALTRRLLVTSNAHLGLHLYRSSERIYDLNKEFPGRITPLQADFSDPNGVSAFADEVSVLGTPAAIVHLPAMKLKYENFHKAQWKRLEDDFTIQVRWVFELLQRFLPKMAKLPRARVVFVLSSVVHGVPPKFMVPYVVTKYAQLGLMRAIAAEYVATPVRINAISPSMVETRFLDELGDLAIQMSASANPLGRNAKPADLLGALELLLSPASDFIHGTVLPIAAGMVS